MDPNKISEYEQATNDAMAFLDADVNLSPETYIHYSLMRMTDSVFLTEDMDKGFAKYAYLSQHAEAIYLSSRNDEIVQKYYEELEKKEEEIKEKYKERSAQDLRVILNKELSLYRIQLIMKHVFDRKSSSEPLRA